MTKAWADGTELHPKYFKWNGSIYHEDDFVDAINEKFYNEHQNCFEWFKKYPEGSPEYKEREKLFEETYNKALEEAEPLTEEEWGEVVKATKEMDKQFQKMLRKMRL